MGAGGQSALQQRLCPADFTFAREEGEDAALGLGMGLHDQVGHGGVEAGLFRQGRVAPDGLHRVGAAFGGHHRRAHELGHRGGVERGGHHQQDQVVAQRARDLEAEREAQIGVEGAFVELVEKHRADAAKFRIGLDHPRQDALGHDLDAGVF